MAHVDSVARMNVRPSCRAGRLFPGDSEGCPTIGRAFGVSGLFRSRAPHLIDRMHFPDGRHATFQTGRTWALTGGVAHIKEQRPGDRDCDRRVVEIIRKARNIGAEDQCLKKFIQPRLSG